MLQVVRLAARSLPATPATNAAVAAAARRAPGITHATWHSRKAALGAAGGLGLGRRSHLEPLRPSRSVGRNPRWTFRGGGLGVARPEESLLRIEQQLARVEREVWGNRAIIQAVGEEGRESGRLWRADTVERLHDKVLKIEKLLVSAALGLGRVEVWGGYKLHLVWPLLGLLGLAGYAYQRRSRIYRKVAEESATLGKEVLERNSRNLVETIEAVSKDPETLAALQVLLVQLLGQQSTRAALVSLLLHTFEDEELCNATGKFLLGSLYTDETWEIFKQQTAELVTATVNDEVVQRETGAALNQVLREAAVGAILPNRWRGRAGQTAEKGTTQTNANASTQAGPPPAKPAKPAKPAAADAQPARANASVDASVDARAESKEAGESSEAAKEAAEEAGHKSPGGGQGGAKAPFPVAGDPAEGTASGPSLRHRKSLPPPGAPEAAPLADIPGAAFGPVSNPKNLMAK